MSPPADETFQRLAHETLEEVLARRPVLATSLGDHRFDDRLDDLSAQGLTEEARLLRVRLATLDDLDRRRCRRSTVSTPPSCGTGSSRGGSRGWSGTSSSGSPPTGPTTRRSSRSRVRRWTRPPPSSGSTIWCR